MATIKKCFDDILRGNKEQSRAAARQVRKILYRADYGSKYQDIKHLVNGAPKQYMRIKENWRQENFVMAISVIYYLRDREAESDFLFPWLFELLQHERGAIRYAAVRMLENELGPLTVHIRHPESKFGKDHVKPGKADAILLSMYVSLQELLGKYEEPKYRRYKYISSLPSSPYKSVQMVLRSMEEDCGEDYLDQLVKRHQQVQSQKTTLSKKEIAKARDDLELEIAQLLEAANSDYTVEDVKKVIYEAEDQQEGFKQLTYMFDTGEGAVTVADWMGDYSGRLESFSAPGSRREGAGGSAG